MPTLGTASQVSGLISMVLLTVLTGLAYPLLILGLAQAFFPEQADGSLVRRDSKVIGSTLIGQQFAAAQYFHPRPSAAGNGYDAANSSGTNKGPTDRKLADTLIAQAVDRAVKEDGATKGSIPADYVTSSASGLDPHISPANADLQVERVAAARAPAIRVALNGDTPSTGVPVNSVAVPPGQVPALTAPVLSARAAVVRDPG